MKKDDDYTVKATCHICGKAFMARYNVKGRAKVCTRKEHACKRKVEKRPGQRDKIIQCVENCCRSQYRRGAASMAMDGAIDPRQVLSDAEFKKVWDMTGALRGDERVALRFIAVTGCRLGEAFLVRQGAISWTKDGYSTVRIPTLKRKGHPVRSVHINNSSLFLAELKAWVKNVKDGEPLFLIPRRSLQAALEKILDKVKVDRDGLVHILRHTRASQLAAAGAQPNYIRQQLGWSSLEMAKIYTHTNTDEISKVLGKI